MLEFEALAAGACFFAKVLRVFRQERQDPERFGVPAAPRLMI